MNLGLFLRNDPADRALMFLAGLIWMICIPLANMGRGTYIDENALQPGQVGIVGSGVHVFVLKIHGIQVNTYWSWREVHAADRHLEDLERLRDINATSQE